MSGDEDLVPLGLLVRVVGGVRVEHDVEGDLPVAVVDVPVVGGTGADGEDDLAGMAGEVLAAAGDAAGERSLSLKKTEWASIGREGEVTGGGKKAWPVRRQSRAAGMAPGSGGGGRGAADG
jgi:hypothetical protein